MSTAREASFRAHLPAAVEAGGDLADELDRLLEAARSEWAELDLDADEFLAYVAARMPEEVALAAAFAQLRAADLYLACACGQRKELAIAAFDAEFRPILASVVARFHLRDALPDDALQMLREKILVGDGQRAAKIVSYSGRGRLENWVRATAVRTLIDLTRQAKRGAVEVTVADDVLLSLPSPQGDPRIDHLKKLYSKEFKQAFEEAARALTSRERNLLRQHFVYGLTTEQIGALYQVHRATAGRWLVAARESLVGGTRKNLGRSLGVGGDDIDSIMRIIESQIEVSMTRLLASVSSA